MYLSKKGKLQNRKYNKCKYTHNISDHAPISRRGPNKASALESPQAMTHATATRGHWDVCTKCAPRRLVARAAQYLQLAAACNSLSADEWKCGAYCGGWRSQLGQLNTGAIRAPANRFCGQVVRGLAGRTRATFYCSWHCQALHKVHATCRRRSHPQPRHEPAAVTGSITGCHCRATYKAKYTHTYIYVHMYILSH